MLWILILSFYIITIIIIFIIIIPKGIRFIVLYPPKRSHCDDADLPWFLSCDELIVIVAFVVLSVEPEFRGDVLWTVRQGHVVPGRVIIEAAQARETHLCPGTTSRHSRRQRKLNPLNKTLIKSAHLV